MYPAFPDVHAWRAIAAWATLALPLAATIHWRHAWWPLILFVLWTLAVALLTNRITVMRWRERSARMLQHAQVSAIRTLSHHRHDWMNDLQIMYGYLRLNKPDRALEIVERIRTRMEHDSRISQLGHAELSMFLLSFRTMNEQMRLEVIVPEVLNLNELPLDADRLAASVIGLVHLFRMHAQEPANADENVLRMAITRSETALNIDLHFEGEWKSRYQLAKKAAEWLGGWGQLMPISEGESKFGAMDRLRISYPLTA